MATVPKSEQVGDRHEDEFDDEWANDPDNPAYALNTLLAHGKIEEAQDELERLVMEGVNSGPGIEMTEERWAELKAELHREAGLTD